MPDFRLTDVAGNVIQGILAQAPDAFDSLNRSTMTPCGFALIGVA
jgi:hypothetical protein